MSRQLEQPGLALKPFGFLDLPGELRNSVYKLYLKDTFGLSRGSPDSYPPQLNKDHLKLAHANKKVRNEWLGILLPCVSIQVAWPRFSTVFEHTFFPVGTDIATPRSLTLVFSLDDEYSCIDLLSLVWISAQRGLTHGIDTALRYADGRLEAMTRYLNSDKTPEEKTLNELHIMLARLIRLFTPLVSTNMPFRESRNGDFSSFGSFNHIYVTRGRDPSLPTSSNNDDEKPSDTTNKVDVLIVLDQPANSLPKQEWHVLMKIYSALRRLPSVKIMVKEVVGETEQVFACEHHNGMRLVPTME